MSVGRGGGVDVGPDENGESGGGMLAIFDEVRRLILSGSLPSGKPVSQVKLSEQLGVSRTPLREALRLLEREGLVVAAPRRRVLVNPLSAANCEDIYVQRILLESFAVKQTVGQHTRSELADLKRRVREMHRRAHQFDFDGWEDEHRCFHNGLYTRVSAGLAEVLRRLSDHAERYRRAYLQLPRTIPVAEAEHIALLESAVAKDGETCGRLLGEHLAHTALAVMAKLDPDWPTSQIHAAVHAVGGAIPSDIAVQN